MAQEGTTGLPYEFKMAELADEVSRYGAKVDAKRINRSLPPEAKYRREGKRTLFSNKDLLRAHAKQLFDLVEYGKLRGLLMSLPLGAPDNDGYPAE